ncbi:hypothetical protein H0H92_006910, partial [Tricholoma furcatifolium]
DGPKPDNIFDDISDLEDDYGTSVADELKDYLDEPREIVTDIITWWLSKQKVYPRLARMAIDYHTVPESTRSLLCLGAWFKSGLVGAADFLAASQRPEVGKGTAVIIIE